MIVNVGQKTLTSFLYMLMLVVDFFFFLLCFQMEIEEVMGGTSDPVDKLVNVEIGYMEIKVTSCLNIGS